MSEFEKDNLNSCDYDSLNATWRGQLKQLGWEPAWGENGPCFRGPDGQEVSSEGGSCYAAWAAATDTPTDLKLGVDKEPPVEPYRKPA